MPTGGTGDRHRPACAPHPIPAAESLVPVRVDGLTLGPTEHLLQVSVHCLPWSDQPPTHWAADGPHFPARAGDRIDRDQLADYARVECPTLQLAVALGFLRHALDQPVTQSVPDRLRARPAGRQSAPSSRGRW